VTEPSRPSGPGAPVPGVVDQVDLYVKRVTAPNPSVMTGPGTNTYLVGDDVVAAVDPGPLDEAHLDRVEGAAGGRIRYVLVTHTHPDHAPGAAALAARSRAQLGGYDARDGFVPDLELRDGDVLELGPVRLRALHTPGHASNHLCYLIEQAGTGAGPEERRLLLSGDHIMGGSTVVISPPDGDMAQYLDSLRGLLNRDPPIDAIAPGHGPILENPRSEIEALMAHRLARERAVSAALSQRGRATVDELVAAVYLDVDPARYPIARRSMWAHLRKLRQEGKACSGDPEDIEATWRTPAP
jgi:glyoxylase-like metal-dependent hydrolase (beta-lactamase superfamily II)